jgi:hypothetical protein
MSRRKGPSSISQLKYVWYVRLPFKRPRGTSWVVRLVGISCLQLRIDRWIPISYYVVPRPALDRLKTSTYMGCLRISDGPLSCRIPLPIYSADIP